MSTRIILRRGTTEEHDNFSGVEGEVTFDTDKGTVVAHTGSGDGTGVTIAKESLVIANTDRIIALEDAKVTTWSDEVSDDKYPSEKLVKDYVDDKVESANDANEIGVNPTGSLESDNVQAGLEELQGDIDTLNADDTTEGSVAKLVKDGTARNKKALGTTTNVRHDKVLGSTNVIEMVYDGDTLTTVRYTGDDADTPIYYRDVLEYNDDNVLINVKHFNGTADLDTESGKTELGYTDGKLTTSTYTE